MTTTEVIGVVFTVFATAIGALHVKNVWVAGALSRLFSEVEAVVREVSQVYTDEIVKGRADGTLTDDEKRTARAMAIAALKRNFGWGGLQRLARVLGINQEAIDGWLGSHVESAVNRLKVQAQKENKS